MEVKKKLCEYIVERKDILVMFWEKESGWNTITKECSVLKNADLSNISLFDLKEWVYPEDLPIFTAFLNQIEAAVDGKLCNIAQDEDKKAISVRLLAANGDYSYNNINCWLDWEDGKVVKIFVMTDLLDLEEAYRIWIAKNYTADQNPMLFQEQAAKLIHDNPDKKYAVIQFDVAKFKMITADFGEEKATELLEYFSSVLRAVCNKYQLFGRLSADIFMIVTPYKDDKEIRDFVEELDKNLLGYDGMSYRLVYGVCYVGDLTGGLRQYGDAAAMARQSIKSNALQKVAFYDNELKKNISTNKFIEDNMNSALENGEFVMYLQPKCNISDGKIVGAEALVRWIMPGYGVVSPNDFVPVFEKNGFIIKMDQYIWEEACKLIRKWIDAGVTPFPISINVSRRHLKNSDFVKVLDDLIEKYDIPKSILEIEITETAEEAGITNSMMLLKKHGFTLLMDDFGSGYSSLNTLKDTQFDAIKIDRSFLMDFIGSDRGQKIVEHTIKMAKDIGIDMVAEGVETKEQAEFLNNCGCSVAQGFYYAKPMPVEQFEKEYIKY